MDTYVLSLCQRWFYLFVKSLQLQCIFPDSAQSLDPRWPRDQNGTHWWRLTPVRHRKLQTPVASGMSGWRLSGHGRVAPKSKWALPWCSKQHPKQRWQRPMNEFCKSKHLSRHLWKSRRFIKSNNAKFALHSVFLKNATVQPGTGTKTHTLT